MRIKKNIAGVIAAALTAMTLAVPEAVSVPVNDVRMVYAEELNSEELEYDNLKYRKVGTDGQYDAVLITGCDKDAESIEIPGEIDGLPVYSLEQFCFENCENLKKVKLSDTLRSIFGGAFYGCSSLESIEIPESVNRIESNAFTLCDSLERIDVAEGNTAFCSVDGVLFNIQKTDMLQYPPAKNDAYYELPDTTYTIKYDDAFARCYNLNEITLPSALAHIYPSSLECCENLEKVTILNPRCDIDDYASTISNGKNGDGDEDYYFSGTICGYKNSTAERYAEKYGCKFEVIEGTPIAPYGDTIWYEDSIGTQYVKIDEDNDGSYDYAEIYCYEPNSKDNEIPAEIEGLPVRVIGFTAAQGSNRSTVIIPDTVKELRENAFCECFIMETMTLPESVEVIGRRAFFACPKLDSITIKNPKCVIYDESRTISNGLNDDYYFDGTIYGYPGSTAQDYAEKYGYKFEAIEGDVPDVPDPVVTTAPDTNTETTETTVTDLPEETPTSGQCGENVTWKYDGKGLLTISGTGPMDNYISNTPFINFKDKISSVIIDNGVTSIGGDAFFDCGNLKEITIPDSVTEIGNSAFYGCESLESIIIPDSVENIGTWAFYSCESLKSIAIPNSITRIESSTFNLCESLESVTIADSVTEIGDSAFSGCMKLKDIIIPDSVTNIEMYAFSGCEGLTKITIPDSITRIRSGTFDCCTGLKNIIVPDSVTEIGNYAFRECTSLESIVIQNPACEIYDSSETICNKAYDSDESYFDGVIYGYENSTAQAYAEKYGYKFELSGESETKPVTTPTEAETTAPSETETDITESTETTAITEGTGESSGKCGENVTWKLDENGLLTISGTGPMYDFSSDSGSYDKSPFLRNSEIKSIIINDGVTRIGRDAFYLCTGIENITIPDSIKNIGDRAFSGCKSLESAVIPDGVASIGQWVFFGCESLKSITIPDSVTSIEGGAFSGCKVLEDITIPDSVTSIGSWAFYSCEAIKSINIPDGVTIINTSAFAACKGLTDITIPDSVTSIDNTAFESCAGLKNITIPDSVADIDEAAFANCKGLESITIKNYDCYIYDSYNTICNEAKEDNCIFNGLIRGYDGSTAQAYAEKYAYGFESIGEYVPSETKPATTTYATTVPVTETTIPSPDITVPTTAPTTVPTTAPTTGPTTIPTTAPTTVSTTIPTIPTTDTPESETPVKGDLSGNNRLDMRDAIEILKYMMGKRKLTAAEREIADYNGDKKINMTDVIAIAKYLIQQASNKK